MVYGRFLDPEPRKAFFEAYKDIESLWEILSPSPELRDHIATFKRLAQLYAAVRNAYAEKVGFVADLAYKTRRLVEEERQPGRARPSDQERHLRCEDAGSAARRRRVPTKAKSSIWCAACKRKSTRQSGAAPILQPLKDRAERILKDLENRKTTGLAAMDLLAALAKEKEAAVKAAKDSGLSSPRLRRLLVAQGR